MGGKYEGDYFRGKRVDNGEWVYGCLITPTFDNSKNIFGYYIYELNKTNYFTNSNNGLEDFYVMPLYRVAPETVGQFTGLYDNKRTEEYPEGKRIFEGDNVNCYTGNLCYKNVVEFNEKELGFCFIEEDGNTSPLRNWVRSYTLEVVGNKFEHKK